MRRTDREVSDFEGIIGIVERCRVCRIGMVDGNGQPYIIPLNFGYEVIDGKLCLYFHSAGLGRKLDVMRANPSVCIEMDCGHQLLEADTACRHGFAYASVMGWGKVEFLDSEDLKRHALEHLMKHETGKSGFEFEDKFLNAIAVYRVILDEITGKESLKR